MSIKISELTSGTALSGTEEVPIVQGASTVKITTQDIADLATSSGATWGSITGTLSSQTDLDTALSGKVPTTRTINGYDLSANRTLIATDVDALKRDGSNANSDVDLGTYSLNTKSVKVNGTAGAGHLGLKHQSSGATAAASESVIYADSSGNPKWKNDGNAVQDIALVGNISIFPLFCLKGISNATTGGVARYITFVDSSNVNASETSQRMIIPIATTFYNFCILTSTSQPATGSSVFTILKNGVDTGITITIAAGSAAGTFSDTTNSVAFSQFDTVSIKWVNNASTSSCQVTSLSMASK